MRLQVSGQDIPAEVLDLIASITDRARLRYAEVVYDPDRGEVRLPLTRLPLVRQRRVLPNVHDSDHPRASIVTVRNVLACTIEDQTPAGFGDEVQLLFGIQVRDRQVYAGSAEESRGQTFYSITLEVSEPSLEINDAGESARQPEA